ncbi:hypothetical protein [Glycomyces algeriensis]|uniref:Uncharacterized protein n=1 Tax=Glycomyces algeriensis TaxID=256037 RepID=A0A9W6LGH2_9ACTN|nr:hypothetical protein [Glycomyces algeriensis]MDA1367951.1 hypothetical protein [Glycomyces algeriensis]MDR7349490.1 hypothetical protein [Glycomyces algeriensis]GLI42195.1 hypothetical protein GALLR39Z86_20450 [Glycomyces algeriensis]
MSESASPQRWGEEHMIDLGAVGEAGPEPEPAPSQPRRFLRIPNAALAYAAIAIALAAAVVTVVKWSPLHRPLAESTVTGFLEAVHDGDVEAALAFTDQRDAEGPYLVPEALDARWEITRVAQVAYTDTGDGKATAEVYAEIEGPDHALIGTRYHVAIDRGHAEIEGAMIEHEAYGSFDYLDLNGVKLELDLEQGPVYILLLPGYYEFYPDLPSTMEFEDDGAMMVLGSKFLQIESGVLDEWMPSPWVVVSQEGEDAVNAALREFYDGCAADPTVEGCPFKFPEDPARELALAPGAQWQVAVYPEVRSERLWYEHGAGFGLESSLPGEAQVQVEITEDGQTRTALVSCPIRVNGLYAAFDFEVGFSIDAGYEMFEDHCRSLVEV